MSSDHSPRRMTKGESAFVKEHSSDVYALDLAERMRQERRNPLDTLAEANGAKNRKERRAFKSRMRRLMRKRT